MEVQKETKLRGLLGMAKKAGRLTCGTAPVCDAIRAGKVTLVLVANDASANTQKRLTDCAAYYRIECLPLPFDREVLRQTVGASFLTAAVGLSDPGFCRAIRAHIEPLT